MKSAPAIGDWLCPRNGVDMPGIVVDILPSGKQCVLARRMPPDDRVVETAHDTESLKGHMRGRAVL